MKARERAVLPVLCMGIVLFGLSGIAAAKTHYEVQRRSLSLTLKVPASDGYSLALAATGHGRVTLTASKGSVSASYTVSGYVSRHRIDASFGDLGRVAVRFRGSPRPFESIPGLHLNVLSPRECTGPRPVREVGAFRGTIRFQGERGFTAADADHAQGEVRRSYGRLCKRRSLTKPPPAVPRSSRRIDVGQIQGTILAAVAPSAGRAVSFMAFGLGDPSSGQIAGLSLFILAASKERRGRMTVARNALVAGEPGEVLISQPGVRPVTATVTLAKPFSGSASYLEAPGAPASWTGTLGVWLPGAGTVPLTGPEFSASLCRATSQSRFHKCQLELKEAIEKPPLAP